jgi:hypothetical protein
VSQSSAGPREFAVRPTSASCAIDNTDWLKTAAIIFVSVDHFGHFFMENDLWWGAFGRLAAPIFFFLMGYARTTTVPLRWVWLGVILTLLESWNAEWTWVVPNILLSLALIRLAHPYAEILVQRHGWVAFGFLVCLLVTTLPLAARCVDYGTEGWLWALFGLCQRQYVDGRSAAQAPGASCPGSIGEGNTALKEDVFSMDVRVNSGLKPVRTDDRCSMTNANQMRLLACVVAAVVYVWQEQKEFSFPQLHFGVFVLGLAVLSVCLCVFRRGPSRIQLAEPVAGILHFIGRHTLEIYAVQLAGSELVIKLWADLAP